MTSINEQHKDKVLACFFGCAIGDALGMPHEFTYGRYPYKDIIESNGSQPIGQVSDDTEMMMALLQTIVKHKSYKIKQVIAEYCRWAGSGVPDIGITTRTLFLQPVYNEQKMIDMYMANFKEMYSPQRALHSWSQSNGCMMRCMPLILFDDEEIWKKDCSLSNPHPICQEAVVLYIRMCRNIILDQYEPLDESWSETTEIIQVIRDALAVEDLTKTGPRNVKRQRGWVLHGLYFAMVMYHHQVNSFKHGMRFVIGCHMDSDTDTNGAIAGAIIGCFKGSKLFDQTDPDYPNYKIIMDAQSQRPNFYHPKHIHDLVTAYLG